MNEKEIMSWDECVHFIAQGAINISEGHTLIEDGSKIHQAMIGFCEHERRSEELAQAGCKGLLVVAETIKEVFMDLRLDTEFDCGPVAAMIARVLVTKGLIEVKDAEEAES